MDETAQVFAENLRMRRCELKMTQKALAERLNYSEKSISKWESGTAIPPSVLLPELAEALSTTIDALFDCTNEPLFYLGIDGGGTKTEFALADRSGTILRRLELGSSNPVDMGLETTQAVFARGITAICDRISPRKISVFAGISGGITGNNRKEVHTILEQYHFARIDNGSDAQSAVALGLGSRDGVAMISGTGSVAFTQRNGVCKRWGGFGYMFDRGGNGFTIGRDAITAALQAEEGSAAPTLLHRMLLEHMNCHSVLDMVSALYAGGKRMVASYAPLVFDAYKQGDRVAAKILQRNTRHMAALMEAAAKPLLDLQPVQIVLVGGMTHQADILRPMLCNHFANPSAYTVTFCQEPVVIGALRLAGMPNASF